MYTSITHINLKQMMLRTTIISLVLMIGALFFTQSAHAQGKPESPGKSEVAKSKSYSDDDSEVEEESEDDDDSNDSNGKSKEIKRMTLRAQEAIARNLERGVGSEQRMLTLSRVLEQLVEIYNRLNDIEDGGDDVSASLLVSLVSTSTEVVAGDPIDSGVFSYEIEVTAEDGDFTIPTTTDAISYSVLEGTDTPVETASGTRSVIITSDATETEEGYVVPEGTTVTFTFELSYEPEEAGTYHVQLESIDTDAGVLEFTPAEDYQSEAVEIS